MLQEPYELYYRVLIVFICTILFQNIQVIGFWFLSIKSLDRHSAFSYGLPFLPDSPRAPSSPPTLLTCLCKDPVHKVSCDMTLLFLSATGYDCWFSYIFSVEVLLLQFWTQFWMAPDPLWLLQMTSKRLIAIPPPCAHVLHVNNNLLLDVTCIPLYKLLIWNCRLFHIL